MAENLAERVADFCQRQRLIQPNDGLVVGVSGGPDSICLLHILKNLTESLNLSLHIAHLNHGLRAEEAQADADSVQALAEWWQIPCAVGHKNVAAAAKKNRQSVEEAAREARYRFLAQTAHEIGAVKIAVAHHADDQAETVLMRFLRGAGVDGLRGMQPLTSLVDFLPASNLSLNLIRPLLEISRSEIEAYCAENDLSPRLDASNNDPAFLRNRVRHQLLPLLEEYNPNIRQSLHRLGDLMSADYEILQKEEERAWRFVVKSRADDAITIDWADWQALPLAMRRRVLRRAVTMLRGSTRHLEYTHIEQMMTLLHKKSAGGSLNLPQNLKLVTGYDSFTLADNAYRLPLPNVPLLDGGQRVPLNIPGVTLLPGGRWYVQTTLYLREAISDDALRRSPPWLAYFDAAALGSSPFLRSRKSGDQFTPFGLDGNRQSIKRFMVNQKIPASQRDLMPLLCSEGGKIFWVCGWRTDHRARVTNATQRVLSVEFKQKVR